MDNIIVNLMNSYGYLGVFFLIFIENVFPPIPSEVILAFGGFMTVKGNLTKIGVIIAATIGSLVGAILLYYLGYLFKVEKLVKFSETKWGKMLGLKGEDIIKADKWFDQKGNISVLICRCIPVLRSLISIPAGISEMPKLKFIIYTISGSLVWNTIIVILGAKAGNNWDKIAKIFDQYSHITIILLFIIFVSLVLYITLKKKNKKI